MTPIEYIRNYFLSKRYTETPSKSHPKSLLWQPDLFFEKDKYKYLILFKTNNSIPPAYLSRISDSAKLNVVPLLIFSKKLSAQDEKSILALGVSIGYFIKGKIINLEIKKKVAKKVIQQEIKKKLEVIDIFVSSKQEIPEREFILNRLEFLRKLDSYPFNPPHLIEYDRFVLKDLYKHIDEVMKNCEWIIIILEDNHSDVVSYEIKKALKMLRHENIFMFVKSTKPCKEVWKKELNHIKNLSTKSVKYLPYNDIIDLEVWLSRAIKKRMNEIQKQNKIQIFS